MSGRRALRRPAVWPATRGCTHRTPRLHLTVHSTCVFARSLRPPCIAPAVALPQATAKYGHISLWDTSNITGMDGCERPAPALPHPEHTQNNGSYMARVVSLTMLCTR